MTKPVKEKENYFSAYKPFAEIRKDKDPAWIVELRDRAAQSFESLNFPTTRDEEWKYTNVAQLLKVPYRTVFDLDTKNINAQTIEPFIFEESRNSRLVFINGLYCEQLSELGQLTGKISVGNISEFTKTDDKILSAHLGTQADYRDNAFTALNTAHAAHGAYVHIPDGKVIDTPIQLLFISSTSEPLMSHPRVLIVAGKGACASIIESYVSLNEDAYFTNAITEVFAAQGSVITHYRLQQESERAFHIGTTSVYQERDSNYTSYAISLGGALVRHNLNVVSDDENTESTIDGLYVTVGNQHTDSHTTIDHRKPNSRSFQLYKGILDDKSRAVFNGKIFVREGALHTDAKQLNKNLLLSSDATVDTKPQLEIFTDDVKCAHGATVGQLSDDEMFYLLSRGISKDKAKALLTYGFAEDVINRIKIKSVHDHLDKVVLEKLSVI